MYFTKTAYVRLRPGRKTALTTRWCFGEVWTKHYFLSHFRTVLLRILQAINVDVDDIASKSEGMFVITYTKGYIRRPVERPGV